MSRISKDHTGGGDEVSYKDVWTWTDDVQGDWTQLIAEDHPALHSVIQAANAANGDSMGAFLCWLAVRVLEMHRVLKPTGSMYLHIDHTAHAYAKAMMDAIFGSKNFRNEIVWSYGQSARGAKAIARQFARNHDALLFYSKGDSYLFNKVDVIDKHPLDKLPSHIMRDKTGAFKTAPRGDYTDASIKRLDAEGRIYRTSSGRIRIKYPLQTEKGFVLEPRMAGSSWQDIPDMMHSPQAERQGYPNQKPLALYQRMILASTNENDLVLDPFAGCATTWVAAEILNRQWIGIDWNKAARKVTFDRLAAEVQKSMAWSETVTVATSAPARTDGGEAVAPELLLVSSPRKRSNTRSLPVKEIREQLVRTEGRRCQGCGWQAPYIDFLQVDHKKPRSLGGTDEMENLTLLCGPCNRLKGNKMALRELQDVRVDERRMNAKWWEEARWR